MPYLVVGKLAEVQALIPPCKTEASVNPAFNNAEAVFLALIPIAHTTIMGCDLCFSSLLKSLLSNSLDLI